MPVAVHLPTAARLTAAALVASALASFPAGAATTTGSLSVRATVELNCRITASAMEFGTYTSGRASDLDANGSVTFAGCNGADLSLALDGGSSNDIGNRTMRSASGQTLRYQLYRNAARSSVAGRNTQQITATAPANGSGSMVIYGRIFAGQTVPAGAYSDTINLVLTF
jgi:spore coat protein U-like protein